MQRGYRMRRTGGPLVVLLRRVFGHHLILLRDGPGGAFVQTELTERELRSLKDAVDAHVAAPLREAV